MIANFKLLILMIAAAGITAACNSKKCVMCERTRTCYTCVKTNSTLEICSEDYTNSYAMEREAKRLEALNYNCLLRENGVEQEKICDGILYSGETFYYQEEQNGYDCIGY